MGAEVQVSLPESHKFLQPLEFLQQPLLQTPQQSPQSVDFSPVVDHAQQSQQQRQQLQSLIQHQEYPWGQQLQQQPLQHLALQQPEHEQQRHRQQPFRPQQGL